MALIRGVGSLFPCPRCLVAESDLWDPRIHSDLRTTESTQDIIKQANEEDTVGGKEKILKWNGLRDIQVPL